MPETYLERWPDRKRAGRVSWLTRFWNWMQRDNEERRWTCEAEAEIEAYLKLKRRRAALKGW